MKKLTLIILFCLLTVNCFSAELLVRAKLHWMDPLTQSEVDKLVAEKKINLDSYNARSQVGDIVVVRPDGWKWGKEECLPNYIVVKVPQITEAQAKKYEESLMVQDGVDKNGIPIMKMLRHRKYALPRTDIQVVTTNNISLAKTVFNSKLITKTGASSEVIQPSKNIALYYWRKLVKKIDDIGIVHAAQFLYKTVKPSGGDYTTLEACMNANEQDLTGDGWFDVEIDGTWSSADTTPCTIHNYTTTADDYINIYTTETARHIGIEGGGGYIIQPTGWEAYFNVGVAYVTITGLIVDGSAGGPDTGVLTIGADYIIVDKCIFMNGAYGFGGISIDANNYNGLIKNTFIFDCAGYNGLGNHYGGTRASNVTAYNCGSGFNANGANYNPLYCTNCLAIGNTTDFGGSENNAYNTSDYNLSSDDTAPGANSKKSSNLDPDASASTEFADVTDGTADLHLKVGANARNNGTALSFTDDIDGIIRTGSWDIGGDEYGGSAALGYMAILIVAGGGGGGNSVDRSGGGGGAGGVRYFGAYPVLATSYTVTVGAGGATNTAGSNSAFSTLVNVGGGRGGQQNSGATVGGSGGGAYHNPADSGADGTATQGNAGGDGYDSGDGDNGTFCGGGGGGKNEAGDNGISSQGGNGGDGYAYTISGSSVTYGGGGGGGCQHVGAGSCVGGTGGTGGGGDGGSNAVGTAGTTNRGSGGGGGGDTSDGGAGGSGIVIIRYVTADFGDCTGGTETTDGADTINTFTSSGTFTVVAKATGGARRTWFIQ